MGVRKPMALHTGHHTKEELAIMEKENEAATSSRTFLTARPPKELIDKRARDIWKEQCEILKDMDIIGDLDAFALAGFANSKSLYEKASKELSTQPLCVDGKTNPLINIQIKYANEMRAFASKAGISVDTRLKYGALHVQENPDDGIDERFGGI